MLVIGSGALKIAEAAEFDYSGNQALKALQEEGIRTILVNPNVASYQTSKGVADVVHFVPLNAREISGVIELERPDSVLLGFGGQSALNAGLALYDSGVLAKYGVKVAGTPIDGIRAALGRESFRVLMRKWNEPVPNSCTARSVAELEDAVEQIGLPAVVRVSHNLGGRGSSVIRRRDELGGISLRAFAQSEIGEVIIEEYLDGWKEIEYEVLRDCHGDSVAVACLENLDPMGVHTGDSVVVAPALTLPNVEYQSMRDSSLRVAEAIGLIGECNVQTALDIRSNRFYVIETNPRMSRSSALASKATGYPLAYVSTKLALGYSLSEVNNAVTKKTTAHFEPSLDYIALKMPRWDLDKFPGSAHTLGTNMQSIGEVLALGRNFEEALQKAARMLDIPGYKHLGELPLLLSGAGSPLDALKNRTPYWPLFAARALAEGASVETVSQASKIDVFYIRKLLGLVQIAAELSRGGLTSELIAEAKLKGFSDAQIADLTRLSEDAVRKLRESEGITPALKCVDTLAGEWPSDTNYYYLTYQGQSSDFKASLGRNLIVLGSGVFRIGVSVEFDWGVVHTAHSAKEASLFNRVFILNCNPETVSTDWDIADGLILDEPSPEVVENLTRSLSASEVVGFAGGQLANNMARAISKKGIRLVGFSAESIDQAEDRSEYSKLLERLGLKQPPWIQSRSEKEAIEFAEQVGYPVLVRPSYVLSGFAMRAVRDKQELVSQLRLAAAGSNSKTVTISKYVEDSLEGEVDGVGGPKGFIGGLIEHADEGGIHSGDAVMFTPPLQLEAVRSEVGEACLRILAELNGAGPFNLQFLVKNGVVHFIEMNLRMSRSMPFTSRAYNTNLAKLSLSCALGVDQPLGVNWLNPSSFAVKTPQFSWSQLVRAYPFLGPEMRSTGEAAHFSANFDGALINSWLSVPPNRLPRDGLIIIYSQANKDSFARSGDNFSKLGKSVSTVELENSEIPGFSALDLGQTLRAIRGGDVDLVATCGYCPELDYDIRRAAADSNVPLVLSHRLTFLLSRSMLRVDNRNGGVSEPIRATDPHLFKRYQSGGASE
jgi:carbamoyl-phosphate synthase large subunit